mmetsp:Transcript_17061/g.25321  ORF Transcript_17061/g.25321 Transcript_17061/m.25321 type:complete len:110 (-) Transcript_17061:29-358(-)
MENYGYLRRKSWSWGSRNLGKGRHTKGERRPKKEQMDLVESIVFTSFAFCKSSRPIIVEGYIIEAVFPNHYPPSNSPETVIWRVPEAFFSSKQSVLRPVSARHLDCNVT